jgi:hypothetical protein
MYDDIKTGLSESSQQIVREELKRLLGSAAFRTSKRCRDFLEHIVEQTIQGPGANLKERSIGVELFHLPPDFDTSQHTVVRVTANEVRKKLAQHYLSESGVRHPVRIELPPGAYMAEFKWEDPPETGAMAESAPASPETVASSESVIESDPPLRSQSPNWLIIGSVAGLLLAVALVAQFWLRGPDPTTTAANSNPRIDAAGKIAAGSSTVRIIAGSTTSYIDRSGRAWDPDSFFSGGSVLVRPSERIARTLDPDIYRHLRQGEFRYDIPLSPGSYELHLHFAETGLADFISAESSGEGQRLFRVSANGKTILNVFDVVADAAGANISDERVFKNISPDSDGLLHLVFSSIRGAAMLSAIELLPTPDGKARPIRIRAGWPGSWHDSAGQEWRGDSYFMGGNALVRTTNPARENNSIRSDTALYAAERWGHFSYALPVAEGSYRVTLRFCEGHYGRKNTGVGGLGSRVFDVYCNGVALLKNFDIFKEAGGEGLPLDRTFTGIRPTAQGKIVLTFVPVVGMACVNGIEVIEDAGNRSRLHFRSN